MKRLIQRYLLSLEKTRNQSVAPPERLDEQELKDLITRLQDVLRRREESKHAADAIERQTKGENKVGVHDKQSETHSRLDSGTML